MSRRGWVLTAALATAFFVALMFLAHTMDQTDNFKAVCNKLHAEFVSSPEWLCIRDGNIVYQGNR